MTSLMLKFNILIDKSDKPKDIKLIKENRIRMENYIKELPVVIENIFEREKELSLKFMDITINE